MRKAVVTNIEVHGGPQDGDVHRMIGWPGDKATVWNADGSHAVDFEVINGRTGIELLVRIYTKPD